MNSEEYLQKLQSFEWCAKRSQILERDHNKCQKCYNKTELERTQKFPVERIKKIFSMQTFPLFEWDKIYTEKLTFELESVKGEKAKLYTSFCSYEDIRRENDFTTSLDYHVITSDSDQKLYVVAVYNKEKEFIYVKGLNVHHKYYQTGKEPWDYPDDALITYCSKCHEAEHAQVEIDWKDETGNLIQKLNPCSRCHSVGYFPEYQHINNGICFRCNGARYEEFIK